MKLHELKKMVKEEFDKFLETDDVEAGAEDVEISVDGEEGGDEDVLRQIYDLLAAHFEGGEEEAGMEDMEDMEDLGDEEDDSAAEDEEEEDDEEELEEASSIGYGDKGGSKKAWYKEGKKKKSKKGALQERFQKLANII